MINRGYCQTGSGPDFLVEHGPVLFLAYATCKHNKITLYSDVILIGTGIMSATLGTLLRQLEPEWTIRIFERMDQVAIESSEAWNNAGTGHSAFL